MEGRIGLSFGVGGAQFDFREAVLAEYPELQSMYAADDGNCEVFALENVTATFCSFTKDPYTIRW